MQQPDRGQQSAPHYPVHGTHAVVVTRWRWDRIAILGAALFTLASGGVYLAVGSGSETEIGSDGVPLILADPTPTRIRPEQPGGMPIANENRLILRADRPTEPPIDVQEILPPPELPAWPAPGAHSAPGPIAPSNEGDEYEAIPVDNGLEAILPTADDEAAEPATQVVERAQTASEIETMAAEPVTQSADLADLIAQSGDAARESAAPEVEMEQTAEALEPAASAAMFAPIENGAWRVQLATVLRPEDAPAEWSRILRRNPDLLGALSPTVIEKERDGRTLYGVQAAPLDEAGARGLCEALKSRSTDCLVVGP